MIEAELQDIEHRMWKDLRAQGASPACAAENVRAAIPLLRASRHAWQDGILTRMRGVRF